MINQIHWLVDNYARKYCYRKVTALLPMKKKPAYISMVNNPISSLIPKKLLVK